MKKKSDKIKLKHKLCLSLAFNFQTVKDSRVARIAKKEEPVKQTEDVRRPRMNIFEKFKRWGYRSLRVADKIYIRNGILGSEFIG